MPDGVWIMNETLQTMRASLVKGVEGEDIRVEGSPDMVLEVISTSSVQKDRERLPRTLLEGRYPRILRVDARKEPLTFDILRQYARGYTRREARRLGEVRVIREVVSANAGGR